MRVLRSRNSGSDVPKLQSIRWGNTQKLRSLIPVPSAPRERPYERLRPLLRLARHGVIFWDRRPRLPRNSHHPEPYTGTRTVLVRSSKPRGPAAAAGGRTSPRTPPPAPDGTPRNPKRPRQFWVGGWGLYSGARGAGGVQTRTRRVSRVRTPTSHSHCSTLLSTPPSTSPSSSRAPQGYFPLISLSRRIGGPELI